MYSYKGVVKLYILNILLIFNLFLSKMPNSLYK